MNEPDPALERADLTEVARRALGSPTALPRSWQAAPIGYTNLGGGSRALYRVGGDAQDGPVVRPWSAVLKQFRLSGPACDEPARGLYWRREALLYQSGLLAGLKGGLAAPACYGVAERPDGSIWLWLEDLAAADSRPWPLERYGLAARHLAGLGARFAEALPQAPWLSQGRTRELVAEAAPQIERLRAGVPPEVLRLWDGRAALLDRLEHLPQTLCHHDIWRQNLFARDTPPGAAQTFAIDWEVAGRGALGEDAGNLLAVSLLNLDLPLAHAGALREEVLGSYLDGLRAAGWRGGENAVVTAALLTAVLRCLFLSATWPLAIAADSSGRFAAQTAQQWGRPLVEVLEQWHGLTSFLLTCAEQT